MAKNKIALGVVGSEIYIIVDSQSKSECHIPRSLALRQ